jgi:hypothetical protein
MHDVTALRRRQAAKDRYDAPGRSAPGGDRKCDDDWAFGWSDMYEGTWLRGLLESRGVNAFADEHLFTMCVGDDPSRRHECTRRERGSASED